MCCIRPIRTDEEYRAALEEIECLLKKTNLEPGTRDGDRLEVLSILVEKYEDEHYPVPLPDPIEAIKYYMETRGLTNADLEPFIGSRSRVWEILNRKRHLTLNMIRRMETGLGIPANILIQQYAIEKSEDQVVTTEPMRPPV